MADYTIPINNAGQQDTTQLIGVNEHEADKFTERQTSNGIKGAWQWFIAEPFSRWPFVLFLFFAALSILWVVMYISDSFIGYLLAGIAAIIMSIYGANHFRVLLGLKEQIDELHKLNNKFHSDNNVLATEVDRLTKTKDDLNKVKNDVRMSNTKLKQVLKKFEQLDNHLRSLGDDSIEGLSKLQESSDMAMKSWKKQLSQHERNVLNQVMKQVEMLDNKEGTTREEFNEFMNRLPDDWKAKLEERGVTFEKYANDDDLLDFKEFNQMLDEISQENALTY